MLNPVLFKGVATLLVAALALMGFSFSPLDNTYDFQGELPGGIYYAGKATKDQKPDNLGGGNIAEITIKQNGEVMISFDKKKPQGKKITQNKVVEQDPTIGTTIWNIIKQIDDTVSKKVKEKKGRSILFPLNKR